MYNSSSVALCSLHKRPFGSLERRTPVISSFSLDKLQSMLQDFYTITHIRITVYNESFEELAAYPNELPRLCELIRDDERGWEACMACDAKAMSTAARQKTPYTYRCHAGMTESIAPIYAGDILIGYLFFGNVFSYESHEKGWDVIRELCKTYQVEEYDLKTAVWQQTLISEDYIASASHILQAVSAFLYHDRLVELREQELPVRIDEYIATHYTETLDAQTLCKVFGIGKTQLYKICRQNYGTGVAEHIRTLRIEKAKALLEKDQKRSIADISAECGFDDYNYFITVFKRETGTTPAKYRKS